jgi:hypothetical protein
MRALCLCLLILLDLVTVALARSSLSLDAVLPVYSKTLSSYTLCWDWENGTHNHMKQQWMLCLLLGVKYICNLALSLVIQSRKPERWIFIGFSNRHQEVNVKGTGIIWKANHEKWRNAERCHPLDSDAFSECKSSIWNFIKFRSASLFRGQSTYVRAHTHDTHTHTHTRTHTHTDRRRARRMDVSYWVSLQPA